MKKLPAKFKFYPFAATVVLGIMLFVGNSFRMTAAIDSTSLGIPFPFQGTTTQQDSTNTDNLCEAEMSSFASKELAAFRQFLETNFQNKSSTTSLLNVAIDKYRELKKDLYTAYSRYSPNVGSGMLATGIQPGACQKIIQDTLSDAQNLLKTQATRTSGVKKSTALLQKYQSINSRLGDLYKKFVYMKAYLDTFSTKLPCYSKSCVKG
jgi:hypothetical protein